MPKASRKHRSDKFPLTLHKTGQYCKKIKGKIYYFGTERNTALQRYLRAATDLHAGRFLGSRQHHDRLSVKMLCNLYLEHQESRAKVGEISWRRLSDQTLLLRDFARFVGPDRLVSDVSTVDIQEYRRTLIITGKAANTINNRIAAVKALYNWATDNEVIGHAPRLKAIKKVVLSKSDKPTFTVAEIRILLDKASDQMQAMIWLALNCAFGCTDCARLKWTNLDLTNSRVVLPRSKTGVNRNLPLWPETVLALRRIRRLGELVFYTHRGNSWVKAIQHDGSSRDIRYTEDYPISKEFSKLMKRAGVYREKGMGFYTLRRTAATLTARSGDPFAVQKLLGHADLKMATTYVQDISEQTDRAINNTRKIIIRDDS